MQQLSHTRLYNALSDLLDATAGAVEDMPKGSRFVVGAEMQRSCISMLRLFASAYLSSGTQSLNDMNQLISELETLKILVTLAIDKGWLKGRNKAAHLIRLLDSVARQSTALRNTFASKYGTEVESRT
jgi:hypothetical protein